MGSRAKPFFACGLLQFLICDVRDIGSASDDRIDAVAVDVNSRNIESGLTERQCERQAYVAQADDAESGRFGFDPVFKLEIGFAFDINTSLNDCAHYECSSISPSPFERGRPGGPGEGRRLCRNLRPSLSVLHSTVTLFAKFRGLSTSHSRNTA